MMSITHADLILNTDGRLYHVDLMPEELAQTVILVGDPMRVEKVSRYFDKIEVRRQNREIITHTGWLGNRRLSVVSTGMGTDNVDVVLNELDALVNVDLSARCIKEKLSTLNFIRIGTTGALQAENPLNSVILSTRGVGFDNLLQYYRDEAVDIDRSVEEAFIAFFSEEKLQPYVASADAGLLAHYKPYADNIGMTASCSGFYGPQGRHVRLMPRFTHLLDKLRTFTYRNEKVANFEMETSGLYGLSQLMGHKALSINLVVTNRALGTFATDYAVAMDRTIQRVLERLP